jgi:pyruvate ferredoxin oxidoreductase beta subunit
MNTGIQRSGSTPLFSATTTTPAGKVISGKQVRRKNLEMIMAAHRIPYIATASLSYLPDLERKIKKAVEVTKAGKGLAFLHVQQPCATGWYFPESKTVEIGKLAVQTGAWPLMEIDEGKFKLNVKPKELRPIAEYLKPQGRFRHLSEVQLEYLQKDAQIEWNALLELEKRGRFPGY